MINAKVNNTSYLLTSLNEDFGYTMEVCKRAKEALDILKKNITNRLQREYVMGMTEKIENIDKLTKNWTANLKDETNRKQMKKVFLEYLKKHIQEMINAYGAITDESKKRELLKRLE